MEVQPSSPSQENTQPSLASSTHHHTAWPRVVSGTSRCWHRVYGVLQAVPPTVDSLLRHCDYLSLNCAKGEVIMRLQKMRIDRVSPGINAAPDCSIYGAPCTPQPPYDTTLRSHYLPQHLSCALAMESLEEETHVGESGDEAAPSMWVLEKA